VATIAGLVVLAGVELAAASALAAIPFIGWALAAVMYAIWAATLVAIAALTVTAALKALIAYLAASGSMTAGDLIAAFRQLRFRCCAQRTDEIACRPL
jgi:hypothetical protein